MFSISFSAETLEQVARDAQNFSTKILNGGVNPAENLSRYESPVAVEPTEEAPKKRGRKPKEVVENTANASDAPAPAAETTDVVPEPQPAIDHALVKTKLTELSNKMGTKFAIDLLQAKGGATRVSAIPLEKLVSFYDEIQKALA